LKQGTTLATKRSLIWRTAAAHRNQGPTTRMEHSLLSSQTALFFKVVFEILQMQLAGQLGMAHFSQFSLRRQTKIHRNLIGGYLFID
jgi:hypothetical protein